MRIKYQEKEKFLLSKDANDAIHLTHICIHMCMCICASTHICIM